jgi:hypothetical protein
MLLSINLNSNRPEAITGLINNVENTANNPSQIEIIFHIDIGDKICRDLLIDFKNKSKVKIKFIETDIIKSYFDLWKPLNELLKLTDPDVYFITNFSDEFRFQTNGWDDIIKKYISYYEDDIFRIRLSRYRYRNYDDPWQCVFAPDSLAFYTKKWMDIVGIWCPCLGPDSWQQLVSYYLINSRKFDHIQYNRDVAEPFIKFSGEGAGIGLIEEQSKKRVEDNLKLWFETVSHEMQEKAKHAASLLKANIIMYSIDNMDKTTFNLYSNTKPPIFKNKDLAKIIFEDSKEKKSIEFKFENKIIYKIDYNLSKWKFLVINNYRKTHFAYFSGGGQESYRKDIISEINTYFNMKNYKLISLNYLKKPKFFKRFKFLNIFWSFIKIFLIFYFLLRLIKIGIISKFSSTINNKKGSVDFRNSPKILSKILISAKKYIKDNFSNKILFYFPEINSETRLFSLLKHFEINRSNFEIKKELPNNKPCFLPITIHSLSMLEDKNFLTNINILKYRKNKNINLLFDLSIEAITFENQTSRILLNFHNILKEYKFDPKRIILINANPNSSKFYSKWLTDNSIDFQITIIGYNFYLFEYFSEVSSNKWFLDNYKLHIEKLSEIKNKKHFMCLNLRPRWHRKAILLFLISQNLLNKGIVTYFGENFGNSDTSTVDSPQSTNNLISKLINGNELLENLNTLDKISPINFERNNDQIRKDLWNRGFGQVEFLIPELNFHGSFTEPLTYFEIVTETWLTDNKCLYFTEKTIRPIIRLNPFIIVGSPNTLNYLREIGFKTFHPFIDESYDKIESIEKRFEMICKEIKRLCSKSDEEMQEIYKQLLPILHHNFNHFIKKTPDIFEKEFNNVLSNLKNNYDR